MRLPTVEKADLIAALRERLGAALHGPAEALAVSLDGLTLRPEAGAHYGLVSDADRLNWTLTYDPSEPGEASVRRGIVTYLLTTMGLLNATGALSTGEILDALWPSSCPQPQVNAARVRRVHHG